jgi:hypothetical protein
LNNIELSKEKIMKNTVIALCTFLATSLLIAGGNLTTSLSPVSEIPAQASKENKIFVEKDVQLMWEDQAYTEAENRAFKRHMSIGKAGSYRHATSYCSRLNYAGFVDWRLPTSDELTHVHHKMGQHFTYFSDNDFWSSTPATEGRYYVVFPADAIRYARSPRQSNYIRCVRCIGENK